jgi:hypothetical protein
MFVHMAPGASLGHPHRRGAAQHLQAAVAAASPVPAKLTQLVSRLRGEPSKCQSESERNGFDLWYLDHANMCIRGAGPPFDDASGELQAKNKVCKSHAEEGAEHSLRLQPHHCLGWVMQKAALVVRMRGRSCGTSCMPLILSRQNARTRAVEVGTRASHWHVINGVWQLTGDTHLVSGLDGGGDEELLHVVTRLGRRLEKEETVGLGILLHATWLVRLTSRSGVAREAHVTF